MMKITTVKTLVVLCMSILLFSGCATNSGMRASNRQKLNNLSPNMSKQEVLSVMGTRTMHTGFDRITNPYRTEMYRSNGKTFELLFYYTDVKKRDNAITDDELTPLIIIDGKLDGWGWTYWNELIQRYEIRVR